MEDEPGPNGRPSYKAFEFQGSRVFLTYSQTTITYDDIRAALGENLGWDSIREFWISKEHHANLGIHWHVLLWFKHRVHNRNAQHLFDVYECHPNIVKLNNHTDTWTRLKSYVSKDGVLWCDRKFDWSKPTNFTRNFSDFKAWERQLVANRDNHILLRKFWTFPGGERLDDYINNLRRPERVQSLWIFGKALTGKSHYAQEQLVKAQASVFCRSGGHYPYDDYAGQSIIYSDDQGDSITKDEICNVLTAHLLDIPVHGTAGTRYKTVYWPKNRQLCMVIITNSMPPFCGKDWFDTRFQVWHVQDRLWK